MGRSERSTTLSQGKYVLVFELTTNGGKGRRGDQFRQDIEREGGIQAM
jgi:hypothetical protein